MKFVKASLDTAKADLLKRLTDELSAGHSVLWLTSGGFNIQVSVDIMKQIPVELTSRLSVMPADERYGEPGHADSNWAQLMTAGFDAKQATLLPILQAGQSFEAAAQDYTARAEQALAANDVAIVQLGMGEDGHILGVLPNTEAVQATGLVFAYDHPSYKRLTLTLGALNRATAIYAFAFGAGKLPALQNLQNKSLSLDDQPAQILWSLSEVYIYNDQVGEA
jgi:6-phosphogluconolactonase/glucosamine-6-phosphate isomerase/deaminase